MPPSLDPQSRRRMAIANACLAVGLLLDLFAHPAGHTANIAVHAAAGVLLGFSITMHLATLRHRCASSRAVAE